MKLKVVFIKKKHLFLFLFFTLILILVILFNLTKNPDIPTFTCYNSNSSITADFNGDDKKDILYLKEDGNNYLIHTTLDNNDIYLKPNKTTDTLGIKSSYWPLRISLIDINRDKLPEICVQGSNDLLPVQHIFAYENDNFKEIFSGNNTITGFININTNRSPILLCGNISDDDIKFDSFYLLHNSLKNIKLKSDDNFVGKNTIAAFINFMKQISINNDNLPGEIVCSQLTSEDYGVIGKLSNENRNFFLQDGYFIDNKYDDNGELEEITWSLNFKGISTLNKDDIKNYTLQLLLTKSSEKNINYIYKISTLILGI